MELLRIQAVNFLSFESAELDFSKYRGIVAIEGKNGAGKSTIVEMVYWLLFGKLLRPTGSRSPDVRNRFSQEAAIVTGAVRLGDGRELSVERRRSGRGVNLSLSFGSGGAATTTGTQEVLETLLGLDAELFSRTVAFSGAVSSFCSMTDSQRKEVLEELIGVGRFLSASARAGTRANELKVILSSVQESERELSDRIDNIRGQIEEYSKSRADEIKALRSSLDEQIERVGDAVEDLWAGIDSVLIATAQRAALLESVEKKQAEIDARLEQMDRELVELRDTHGGCRESRAVLESRIEELKKKIRDARSKTRPAACPTCLRPWKNDDSHLKSHIDGLERELTIKDQELSVAKLDEERAADAVLRLDTQRGALARSRPSVAASDRALDSALNKLTSAQSRMLGGHAGVASARRAFRQFLRADPVSPLRTSLAQAESALSETAKNRAKIELELEEKQLWKEGFSKHGIPAQMLHDSIPMLNRRSDIYIRHLTDGAANVFFTLDDDRFNVEVSYSSGADTYDMTSRGEHTRADVAALLSIRDLMASRVTKAWTQVFMDEVFDGLDAEGTESVVRMLRAEMKNQTVFLISHSDALRGMADHVISIEKRGNTSEIIECR